MSRRRDPKSAPAVLACPYCRKARWTSLRRLNSHIGHAHEESPQVTPESVISLILSTPKQKALLEILLARGI